MNTEITFYSGIHTIGGVVMTIRYKNHQILLEMGASFSPDTDVYSANINLRETKWLHDFCMIGKTPSIEYIYDKEMLQGYDLESAQESNIHTACFITHLHQDHMSNVGCLSDKVDVYMSKSAQTLFFPLIKTEPFMYTRTVPFIDMRDQEIINIGDIKVTPFLLNEDGFQDWSFYIETPDCKIHYTGDVLLHGHYNKRVINEMNIIKNKKIDILVCESTAFMDSLLEAIYGKKPSIIEPTLDLLGAMSIKENDEFLFNELYKQTGLCLLNFYPREMLDIQKFEKWASETNRTMIYEPEAAYMINHFFDKKTRVYIPDNNHYLNNHEPWYLETVAQNEIVTADDIITNARKYILQSSYSNSMELFNFNNLNFCYIHAGGTPLGAYDSRFENMVNLIKKANGNFITFNKANYLPHAYPQQLKYYVDNIDANILIPTHGFNPEMLKPAPNKEQFIPELGKTYIFTDKKLIQKEEPHE